jgi:flagellar protein FlaG
MSVESLGVASTLAPDAAVKRAEPQAPDQSRKAEVVAVRPVEATELSPDMIDATVEKLEDAIDQLNSLMRDGQRTLNFSVEKDLNKVVVKVMDVETEEIIRQFPDEQALKFAKHLEGMMGLLFNDKA